MTFPIRQLLLVCSFICMCLFVNGQSDSLRQKSYKSWIISYEKPKKHIGILFKTADSSVTILKSNLASIQNGKAKFETLNTESILKIDIRKRFNVEKGILYGSIASMVLGTITNLVLMNHGYEGPVIIANTEFLIIMGISMGALVGSLKIKIPVKGNQKLFEKYQTKLNRYTKVVRK
jgi:hypothetical protein